MFYHHNNSTYRNVYPGTYSHSTENESVMNLSNYQPNNDIKKCHSVIYDLKDIYKIHVELEASNREEISIKIDETVAFITVTKKKGKSYFNDLQSSSTLTSYIILPSNADPEFMSAEFNEGILTLHMPKSEEVTNKIITEIIVY